MREEDFTHFLGPLPEPYLLVSASGELLAINPAAARVLDLEAEQAPGVDLARLAQGAEEPVREYLRDCARSASFIPGSLTIAGLGVPRRVRCEGCALPNAPGSAASAAVLLRLKQSEPATDRLRQLERKVQELTEEAQVREYGRGVLESIGDPIVVQDDEWRFRFINGAAAEIFRGSGHGPPSELIGRVVWDEYPELVGTRLEHEMRRAARERVPVAFEEYYAGNGTWSELRCYPLPGGGLATVWKDVTERKRSESAMRVLADASRVLASSLDFDATLRRVAAVIVPALADYCLIDVREGDAFRRVASLHADPARDELMRVAERYPPRWEHDGHVIEAIRSGRPLLVGDRAIEALEGRARDGTYARMVRELAPRSFMIVPLKASSGVLGALTFAAAESGRRYVERDLAVAEEVARRASLALENARLFRAEHEARAEAERASRAKSQFLAVMSHELRTPLNAVLGYADLLDAEIAGPINAAQRAHIGRVREGAGHLRSLIDQVLSLARIEAGREDPVLESVDFAALARQVAALVEPLAAQRGLGLVVDVPGEPIVAVGDAGKVRQILLNLLANAIKFTESGAIRLHLCSREGVVLWEVRDTGVGIDACDQERIFEPFTQVDQSSTRSRGGTGLGLPVSRQLARLLGGDVTVESRPGEGSTFSLRLPGAGVGAGG